MSEMRIIVEVKNDFLGNGIFWQGPAKHISKIRNIPARMLAEKVVKDGKPRQYGMWHVRAES